MDPRAGPIRGPELVECGGRIRSNPGVIFGQSRGVEDAGPLRRSNAVKYAGQMCLSNAHARKRPPPPTHTHTHGLICVCVCVCARAPLCACVHMRVRVRLRVRACACVCARARGRRNSRRRCPRAATWRRWRTPAWAWTSRWDPAPHSQLKALIRFRTYKSRPTRNRTTATQEKRLPSASGAKRGASHPLQDSQVKASPEHSPAQALALGDLFWLTSSG